MKNTFFLFLTITFLCSFAACSSATSNSSKETRNLKNFTKIILAIPAELKLIQGNEYKFEIEADNEDLKEIETIVDGSTLKIRTKNRLNRLGHVVINITLPEINYLSIAGSGSIISDSKIVSSELELNVNGSGSIIFNELSSEIIIAEINGSGEVELNGDKPADKIEIEINGSGHYKGISLSAKEINVNIAGSGSATVNATEKLYTNITGSGEVSYSGRPTVNANSVGSGKTRSIN